MRIVGLAARGAALGILVASCGTNQTSGSPSSGTTGAGTTAGSTSSTSSGAGGSAAGAIIDMFCNAVADAACEADFACCAQELSRFPYYPNSTVDDCKKALSRDTSLYYFCLPPPFSARPALEASLQAGKVVFDQAQFDTCLALLKSMAAGGAACIQPPINAVYTTCLSAFRGQLEPGDACLELGWSNAFIFCKDGFCSNDVCVPFLKPGDACLVMPPWGDHIKMCNWAKGESCHGDPGGGDAGTQAMGICAPKGEIGDACHPSNDFECRSYNCDTATSNCALSDPYQSACVSIF